MDRRDFLGAVAAVFCHELLPEPVRERLYTWQDDANVWVLGNHDIPKTDAFVATFHQYYQMVTSRPDYKMRLIGITDEVMREALETDAWRDISPVWSAS